MRLWSLHPKYLDTKGLVALWRETLLAKNVLEEKTKGYKNHPQLNRFYACKKPLDAINYYLAVIWENAHERGYNFNSEKFTNPPFVNKIKVNNGQVKYESEHLLNKLKLRAPDYYNKFAKTVYWHTHPLFKITIGEIEAWEKI